MNLSEYPLSLFAAHSEVDTITSRTRMVVIIGSNVALYFRNSAGAAWRLTEELTCSECLEFGIGGCKWLRKRMAMKASALLRESQDRLGVLASGADWTTGDNASLAAGCAVEIMTMLMAPIAVVDLQVQQPEGALS